MIYSLIVRKSNLKSFGILEFLIIRQRGVRNDLPSVADRKFKKGFEVASIVAQTVARKSCQRSICLESSSHQLDRGHLNETLYLVSCSVYDDNI